MKPRKVLLDGCNEIAKALVEYGFKPLEKGRRLKKIGNDNRPKRT